MHAFVSSYSRHQSAETLALPSPLSCFIFPGVTSLHLLWSMDHFASLDAMGILPCTSCYGRALCLMLFRLQYHYGLELVTTDVQVLYDVYLSHTAAVCT